jgi:hypothetical protein
MNQKRSSPQPEAAPDPSAMSAISPGLAGKAARRLRLQRLARRVTESLDRLVRAEEKARTRLGHPVWTDRLRTREVAMPDSAAPHGRHNSRLARPPSEAASF